MASRNAALGAVLLSGTLLAACAQTGGSGYQPSLGSPGVGTLAGAAGGAALGRWAAGGNNNLAGILGGAAVGALAGNVLMDGPKGDRQHEQAQVDADVAQQRQLEYERQRQLQQAQTDREIREREAFEEWKRTRGFEPAPSAAIAGPVNSYGDVVTAQRYLTALGYYDGKIDGVIGPGTRSAVTRFQNDRGLSPNGEVSPGLLQQMRTALG
jgi:hypothetical protein